MRALILGAGGSRGAHQLGVLRHLLDTERIDYDIYCGVSVGAINSILLATGPLEETLPQLEQIWLEDIKGDFSIYTHHLWNYILAEICIIIFFVISALTSFFFGAPKLITTLFMFLALLSIYLPYISLRRSNSVYNTEPLRNILKTKLSLDKLKNSGKKLLVGAVAYETGEYKIADETDPKIISWVMASSAFPILFPMENIDGKNWTDIGAYNVPISEAIKLGATEIDVILTTPIDVGNNKRAAGIVWQLLRLFDITSSKALNSDINLYRRENIKVRVFAPKDSLDVHLLNFNPAKIKLLYDKGKEECEKILSNV